MISKFDDIIEKLNQINPVKYSKDRNFIDGSVSKLSPYISRGIISTKFIYKFLILKRISFKSNRKICSRTYIGEIIC